MKKTIALIPARGGSKRVPHKNIRELAGKPLVAWAIATALDCNLETYVSTDSDAIADVAIDYGAYVITRPEHLAWDNIMDYFVIHHALKEVDADLVVYLRPTTPFRSADRVSEAIRSMSTPYSYPSLRSVHEMSESVYKCFEIKAGVLKHFGLIDLTDRPNQELTATYRPNGYVDIVRAENIKEGSLWGEGPFAFITPRTPEIDTLEDFEYAEWYAMRRP